MTANTTEAKILSRIKQDHLTCHICRGPYNEPKALPCLHTFCMACLQDYFHSRGYEVGSEFPCPVCRYLVPLTKHGIGSFPDNHLVVTLMDTVGGEVLHENLPGFIHSAKDTAAPSTGLYPKLSNLFENQMSDVQTPRHVHYAARSDVRPGVKYNCPVTKQTRTPSNHERYHTPTAPQRPAPLQRKLMLSTEQYPIQIETNRNGAQICFGQFGKGLADFDQPVGLAISSEGYIIVGDQRGNRVFIFERHGNLRTIFTCQGNIQDLAANELGLIYIANTHARKSMVVCYNDRGHTIASFGNFFTYEKPHGIAITSSNHMVITSIETNLVYVLNEYGKMTHKFTGKGRDGKRLSHPYHVAVTKKDKIVVSDYGNDCIKVFDRQGKFKLQFGKSGSKPAQFSGPRGICIDGNNNIVVADSRNHRIQAFTSQGQLIRVVMEMTSIDRRLGGCPMNVAITDDNKLVVLITGATYSQVRVYPYIIGNH